MRDYRRKTVKGIIFNGTDVKLHPCNVVVQMTSDKKGKTLSFGAEEWMISIPLESVTDIIRIVEKE